MGYFIGLVYSRKSQLPRRKYVVSDSDDDDDDYNDKDYSVEDESNQLVLRKPRTTHPKQRKLHEPRTEHPKQRKVQFTKPIYQSTPVQQRSPKAKYGHSRVYPAIGAYTVQCANCYKWRIVPTKEKFEELRETICRQLFVCARASEWNRDLSCDESEDMSQDESKVWALDRPEIPQPPPGWDRELRIRPEGGTQFADVYYKSPSGTTLRSMVEIGRYLQENPYYIQQGVNLSQFSMLSPKPLQEDYVRRPKYSAPRCLQEPLAPLDPVEADALGWAPPPSRSELLRMGASASNPVDLDDDEPVSFEAQARRTKKRTPMQASPSSSEHTRSTLTEASTSGKPKKRVLKQVSTSGEPKKRALKQVSSRCRPTAPPNWPRDGHQSDIEYYKSPSGTTLRSMVEIGRYLQENPYYIQQGVNLSQFSMLGPKPLQEDYVRRPKYSGPRHLQKPLAPLDPVEEANMPPNSFMAYPLKQVSSRRRPTAPPNWPHGDHQNDIEYVLL